MEPVRKKYRQLEDGWIDELNKPTKLLYEEGWNEPTLEKENSPGILILILWGM